LNQGTHSKGETMPKLPIGLEELSQIRSDDFVYADKTKFLYQLIMQKSPYFLSRPRRFGKTLLVSTLKAILQGRKELFNGLWIGSSDYDWVPHPVINLKMNGLDSRSVKKMENSLIFDLKSIAEQEKVKIDKTSTDIAFKSLFQRLHDKYGKRVAILIDEYDAPILNQIDNPKLCEDIRDSLKIFYDILKAVNNFRGFTFITGVTKFAKSSIFSTLNNLVDLTLHKEYASICGFTIEEFDAIFPDFVNSMLSTLITYEALPKGATYLDLKKLILAWYDGYTWDGVTKILNPWAILELFDKQSFGDYWCATGGKPSFLVSLAKSGKINFNAFKTLNPIKETMNIIELGTELKIVPLMFQAGYLTVSHVDMSKLVPQYYLDYPNLEVKSGIISLFLSIDLIENPLIAVEHCKIMHQSLVDLDATGFANSFGKYLACFSFSIHEHHESFYHALFQSAMFLAGVKIDSEGSIGDGKFDAYYKASKNLEFVFEIKYCPLKNVRKRDKSIVRTQIMDNNNDDNSYEQPIDEGLLQTMQNNAALAMKQIEENQYTKPFKGTESQIYKVALVVGGRTNVLAVFKKEVDTTPFKKIKK
jgi:hypothetical protein